jgi:hypothetical protein
MSRWTGYDEPVSSSQDWPSQPDGDSQLPSTNTTSSSQARIQPKGTPGRGKLYTIENHDFSMSSIPGVPPHLRHKHQDNVASTPKQNRLRLAENAVSSRNCFTEKPSLETSLDQEPTAPTTSPLRQWTRTSGDPKSTSTGHVESQPIHDTWPLSSIC